MRSPHPQTSRYDAARTAGSGHVGYRSWPAGARTAPPRRRMAGSPRPQIVGGPVPTTARRAAAPKYPRLMARGAGLHQSASSPEARRPREERPHWSRTRRCRPVSPLPAPSPPPPTSPAPGRCPDSVPGQHRTFAGGSSCPPTAPALPRVSPRSEPRRPWVPAAAPPSLPFGRRQSRWFGGQSLRRWEPLRGTETRQMPRCLRLSPGCFGAPWTRTPGTRPPAAREVL